MPEEEKKEKKVTPFFFSKKTQAKKESFTFSDKIKNSKPASSKSFASRASSKIGSDGKPRQTLFERTKRDAPFFIAALVALLLLPFLYKYSGNVDENPALVTPTYEDSAFNPERSGFDSFAGDPEGQIAQLAGRDSMSLILPFGGAKNTEEEEYDEDYSRNAYNDQASSASHSLSEQDEEENITNIYKYRKKAPAATRAAFKRTATKVNRLGNAGRAGAPGSKLGVGMWGGGMKAAANKVPNQAPQSAPKPVSLQPLQAAGKPSRSYFGQAPAREAARSKDAMSKANAMQALMDAQMKPVEPGKIGGVFGGDFGGPGGGNGDLKREFAYSGKEPWWWDMMKQRSMMEWQKNFEFKWSLINWATDLLKNIFGGVINCLITGKDNGEMGKMFGAIEGAGGKAKCCGLEEDLFRAKYKDASEAFPNDFEKACKAIRKGDAGKAECPSGWKGASTASANMSAWGVRMDCLTNGWWSARKARRANDGVVTEENDCYTFYQTGYYKAVAGPNRTIYHYVVGVPFDKVKQFFDESNASKRHDMLEIAYFSQGDDFTVDSTVESLKVNQRKFMPLFIESVAIKNNKIGSAKKATSQKAKKTTNAKGVYRTYYNEGASQPGQSEPAADTEENAIAKDIAIKLKNGSFEGYLYKEFKQMLSQGGMIFDGENQAQLSTKGSKKGKNWNTGARCAYPLAFISCHNDAWYAGQATIESGETTPQGYMAAFLKLPNLTAKGGKGAPTQSVLDMIKQHFMVTNTIQRVGQNEAADKDDAKKGKVNVVNIKNIHASSQNYPAGEVIDDGGTPMNPRTDTYTVLSQKDTSATDKQSVMVTWEVRQHYNPEAPWAPLGTIANGQNGGATFGQIVSSATCSYGEDPVGSGLNDDSCKKGDENKSEKCCKELKGKDGFVWNKETKACEKPAEVKKNLVGGNPPAGESTRLAKYFAWIPKDSDCRNAVKDGEQAKADSFCPEKKIKVGNDDQHCVYPVGELVMNSTTAKEFVKQVVAEYNKKYPTKPIVYDNSYPTTGEFADALNIAKDLNISQVSKSAVCELGRRMVQVSRDPYMKSADWHNELGAFFAYIHKESVFYPAKYYKTIGNCDKRFMAIGEGGCPKTSGLASIYHHNNYTYQGRVGMNAYQKSAQALGLPTQKYPLAALADNLRFDGYNACYNRNAKGYWVCGKEVNAYKKAVDPLINSAKDSNGQGPRDGNACDVLSGNMQVQDALDYVVHVCQNGLDKKPSTVASKNGGRRVGGTAGGNTENSGYNSSEKK